jgi:hypothetical protein
MFLQFCLARGFVCESLLNLVAQFSQLFRYAIFEHVIGCFDYNVFPIVFARSAGTALARPWRARFVGSGGWLSIYGPDFFNIGTA